MSTFSIPSIDTDGASSLASVLNSSGIPFTLSPSTSGGYSLDTDSANSSTVQSMLNSAGLLGSSSTLPTAGSSTSWEDALANVYGNADTSNDGAGSGVSNNNGDTTGSAVTSSVSSLVSKYGTDGVSIVVGVLFVAGSVYGMMTK